MDEYVLLVITVFAVNLLPVFGPPSWAVLVFFRLKYDIPTVPLVLLGAASAASGRLLLATAANRLRGRFSERRLSDLDALRNVLEEKKSASLGGLILFALSPVPSAQLFIAAGITGVRLVPLTAAFFAGRLVSYSIYTTAATVAAHSFENVLEKGIGSPLSIGLQLATLAALVALALAPWNRLLVTHLDKHTNGSPDK